MGEYERFYLEVSHDIIKFVLTPRQYDIYVMATNMKYKTIAEKLKIELSTVKNTIRTIKKKLNKLNIHFEDSRKLRVG